MTGERIMIVEDDGIISAHLQYVLTKKGYSVCGTAQTGEDAISLAADTHPDLILMDVVLDGEMDGIDAAARISEHHQVPIIYLTAYADPKIIERAKLTGPYGYLLKPFEERNLYASIETALQKYQLELRLFHSEARFRSYFELSPVGMAITATDQHILDANQSLSKILGYSIDELRQIRWADLTYPEDLVKSTALLQQTTSNKADQYSIEKRYVHKNGRTIYALIHVSCQRKPDGSPDYYITHIEDITQQKEAEEALRDSEERFRQLAENIREVFWIRNFRNDSITYISPTYEELFNHSRSDVYSDPNSFIANVHPDDHDRVQHAFTNQQPGNWLNEEFRVLQMDGTVRWVWARMFPIQNKSGDIYRLAGVAEDITEQKILQHEQKAIATLASALRIASTRQEMFPIILANVIELIDAEGAALSLRELGTNRATIQYAVGTWDQLTGVSIPETDVNGKVMETGQSYINNMAAGDPDIPPIVRATSIRSVACAPMIARKQTIGTLWIGRNNSITQEEMRMLGSIADMAASAIQRETLHEQTERQLKQVQALRIVDSAISANMEIEVILDLLLEQVLNQLSSDAANILIFDPLMQSLKIKASAGFKPRSPTGTRVQLDQDPAGHVVLVRNPVILALDSDRAAQSERMRILQDLGYQHYYGVPLLAKGQVKGVIELIQKAPFSGDAEWQGLLDALAVQAALAIDNWELVDNLQRTNQQLSMAYDATLAGWARALNLRDQDTEEHSQNVIRLTVQLARVLGFSEEQLVHIRRGALLHDIGKMGIPDRILRKPGPLDEDEMALMQQHPVYAYNLLYPIPFLRPALNIPYCHHEKWSGGGYPRRLRGEQIPLEARIFAIVDVWDSLCSDRAYRKAWPKEKALLYIQNESGQHFDPRIVEEFLKLDLDWQDEHRYSGNGRREDPMR